MVKLYTAARLVMEVAPPRLISVARRRVIKMLDTIAEEDKEVGAFDIRSSSSQYRHSCSPST